MSDFREKLLDRMIHIYGFEHPLVIQFAEACESYVNYPQWDRALEVLVEAHEAHPYKEQEEMI